jgi:hypothetical protein
MEFELEVKFKPRKLNLEPNDITQLSNLADGEVVKDSRGKHEPGASFVINHGVDSKKFPSLTFPAPNPIEFYLFSTYKNLQNIIQLEKEIQNDVKKVNALLLEEIQFCIFSICALEAFVNQIIPADYEYKDKERNVPKTEIERWWPLEDKFKKVVLDLTGISIASDSKEWGVITDLIDLRNHLIHLKTLYPQVSDFRSYQELYRRLLDNEYDKIFTVVKSVMGKISASKTWDPVY